MPDDELAEAWRQAKRVQNDLTDAGCELGHELAQLRAENARLNTDPQC